ncbi:hypothetical protein D915_009378 [Fasciola hepatica]|uniref:DUF2452 domain-containing protein n=1 Tax=Fasciola hepatica TaxID=6192 RepID=A0A2H1BXZ7_FASHE|nr:hypothetical protein D915_009378 [Fasciola hepatica]
MNSHDDNTSNCQPSSTVPDTRLSQQAVKIATATDFVEIAKQIQDCEQYVSANACSRLHLIVKQMQYLKKQAEEILAQCQRDVEVHKLPCNFVKKPGNTYYVYQRPDGSNYLSLLSPEEWGPSCPNIYLGAYKLMPDMTWKSEDQLSEWNQTDKIVQQLMSTPGFLPIDSEENV